MTSKKVAVKKFVQDHETPNSPWMSQESDSEANFEFARATGSMLSEVEGRGARPQVPSSQGVAGRIN